MKKIVLTGLAVSAALIAGQANANTPLPMLASGMPNWAAIAASDYSETFIAGSSAATPFLEEAMRADCTGNIYKYSAGGSLAYLCSKADTATTIPTKFLLMHKRDGGGSINGVKAVKGTLQSFLDVPSLSTAASCGAASNSIVKCTGGNVALSATQKASELNFADVDPAQFDSPKNGGFPGLSTGVSASAVATQVFGIIVNNGFRNALQKAAITAGALPATCTVGNESEACMPSLTSRQIATIFANNGFTDWSNLAYGQTYVYNFLATDPSNSDIHICGRSAGSGTWASMNIKFENAPCNGGFDQAYTMPTTPTIGHELGNPGSMKVVHANSGSSDLEDCMTALDTGAAVGTFSPYPVSGKRWAIGVMGTERNGNGALPYRFIKVDGVAPSAANVANGKYIYWAELVSMGAPTTDPLGQDLLKNLSNPLHIANLNINQTWQTGNDKSGFLGVANNVDPSQNPTSYNNGGSFLNNAQYDYRRPVNPYTHATLGAGVNHCRVPTMPAIPTSVMPLM